MSNVFIGNRYDVRKGVMHVSYSQENIKMAIEKENQSVVKRPRENDCLTRWIGG